MMMLDYKRGGGEESDKNLLYNLNYLINYVIRKLLCN